MMGDGGDRLIQPTKPPLTDVRGRRLRALMRIARYDYATNALLGDYGMEHWTSCRLLDDVRETTWRQALKWLDTDPICTTGHEHLNAIPLRTRDRTESRVTTIDQVPVKDANPSLSEGLRDLVSAVIADLIEAYGAFEDPNFWYPGVDDGILPVPDDHVRLVIWGMQRELTREKRSGPNGGPTLPGAPLAELPFRVQRALVERRRLRFAQWGIGRAEWESGYWSLWRVPEDSEWMP